MGALDFYTTTGTDVHTAFNTARAQAGWEYGPAGALPITAVDGSGAWLFFGVAAY
ncbi:hypothetical protein [Streptomyces sp. NPDC001137]|uniref:hypothetical protein n=1 Tax=Streptomyces sp. NPDC001137 TaxID=3154378 RepID=UPI0033261638